MEYIKYAWLLSELSMVAVAYWYFSDLQINSSIVAGVIFVGAIASAVSLNDKF